MAHWQARMSETHASNHATSLKIQKRQNGPRTCEVSIGLGPWGIARCYSRKTWQVSLQKAQTAIKNEYEQRTYGSLSFYSACWEPCHILLQGGGLLAPPFGGEQFPPDFSIFVEPCGANGQCKDINSQDPASFPFTAAAMVFLKKLGVSPSSTWILESHRTLNCTHCHKCILFSANAWRMDELAVDQQMGGSIDVLDIIDSHSSLFWSQSHIHQSYFQSWQHRSRVAFKEGLRAEVSDMSSYNGKPQRKRKAVHRCRARKGKRVSKIFKSISACLETIIHCPLSGVSAHLPNGRRLIGVYRCQEAQVHSCYWSNLSIPDIKMRLRSEKRSKRRGKIS